MTPDPRPDGLLSCPRGVVIRRGHEFWSEPRIDPAETLTATRKPILKTIAGIGAAVLLCLAPSAQADPGFVPRELIVSYRDGHQRVVRVPNTTPWRNALHRLRADSGVEFAVPNYRAYADSVPNDPGIIGVAGGWRSEQWNFLSCGTFCGRNADGPHSVGGIDAIGAWQELEQKGIQPGAGATVAILDSGIALKNSDFTSSLFKRGYDFVDMDSTPTDTYGHGTHVAATIAEAANNGFGLTGLAPSARVIPVRVLDSRGRGTASGIAKGIRYAVSEGADVINMSFEFTSKARSCADLPSVCSALAFARKRGVLTVASAGKAEASKVAFPARAPNVLGVGRTTADACPAANSRFGDGLDLVAPGGGTPKKSIADCRKDGVKDLGSGIVQYSLDSSKMSSFSFVSLSGPSMAAAHVSGVAALVISSKILGGNSGPSRLACQLRSTARRGHLGSPFSKRYYGAGLLDAARAVESRAAGC